MSKCKFCGKDFDANKGWRNDCPKDFCSWYCAVEWERMIKWEKETGKRSNQRR